MWISRAAAITVLAGLAVCSTALTAQQASDPQGTIRGSVLDGATGRPVAEATVTLQAPVVAPTGPFEDIPLP